MDSRTGAVLDRYQETLTKEVNENEEDDDIDDDEFMELLEDLPSGYREKRMAQLQEQMTEARHNLQQGDYGKVSKVTEKEVFEITTEGEVKFVVVHFYHPDFKRCKIMSQKLQKMAKKHLGTRFIEVEGPEAPFLVTKLNIKVLPCVIGYINGQEVMRLVGFEQLGNQDDFTDHALQFQLYKSGLVKRMDESGFDHNGGSILGFKKSIRDSNDGSDSE